MLVMGWTRTRPRASAPLAPRRLRRGPRSRLSRAFLANEQSGPHEESWPRREPRRDHGTNGREEDHISHQKAPNPPSPQDVRSAGQGRRSQRALAARRGVPPAISLLRRVSVLGALIGALPRRRLEPTIEPLRLLLRPCGKKEHVRRLLGDAVAEADPPQAIDGEQPPVRTPQPPEETAGREVEGIDPPIAEVAHEQAITEAAEVRRGQREAPGRIQRAAGCEALDKAPVGIEDVDQAKPFARHVIFLVLILLGISDVEIAIEVADAKRGKPRLKIRIRKGPSEGRWVE